MAFAIQDKFGALREEKFTELGNKICLVCDKFGGVSAVNTGEILLEFNWKVCVQAIEPFRNISNPTLQDYKYQEIVGASNGYKSYSNNDLRVDLEIVNGVPTPKFEQAKGVLGELLFESDGVTPIMTPIMIGNIDFWMKFGGDSIIQDLNFTLYQISMSDISNFIKL